MLCRICLHYLRFTKKFGTPLHLLFGQLSAALFNKAFNLCKSTMLTQHFVDRRMKRSPLSISKQDSHSLAEFSQV